MKIKDISATFENGDILTLSLKESTQVLAGSNGKYKLLNETDKVFLGSPEFVVTQDTYLDAEKLPVKFINAAPGDETWIYMHEAELIK